MKDNYKFLGSSSRYFNELVNSNIAMLLDEFSKTESSSKSTRSNLIKMLTTLEKLRRKSEWN